MIKAITVDDLINKITDGSPVLARIYSENKCNSIGSYIVSQDQNSYGNKVSDLAGNIAEEILEDINQFFAENPDCSNLDNFRDSDSYYETASTWAENACIYYSNTVALLADSPDLGLLEEYRIQFGDPTDFKEVFELIAMELHCWMISAANRFLDLIEAVLEAREELAIA